MWRKACEIWNKHKSNRIDHLVSWEIWDKRSARVFHNKHGPPSVIFDKSREAKLQVIEVAKRMSKIIPRD
jgi:hypothetical protein